MTEDEHSDEAGQMALMPDLARSRAREARERSSRRAAGPRPVDPAAELPVARVLVDVPLAHLDRPFDYLVPRKMASAVVPGSRVKVRFGGQDVDGFVLERVEHSDHEGRLAPLRRAVSPEPVLAPQIARLSASLAARYAGTRSDVLRLAVPARHATVEKEESAPAPAGARVAAERLITSWARYDGGAPFLRRLTEGESPRAVWSALPGDWPARLAEAAAATQASGRGVLLCLPDRKDVDRVDRALTSLLGEGRHVVLTADLGPAARYRAFLAVARGAVDVVIGTRAAAFAPVHRLGLVGLWDDGDDLFAEQHAPYPHTREVLLQRAHEESCGLLLGGFARSVEAEYLLRTGWAQPVAAPRTVVRDAVAQVRVAGATDRELDRDPFARSARLPHEAFAAIRDGLRDGPVLLQTPRLGYVTTLACEHCRAPARCPACTGPLSVPAAHRPPACRWCGREEHAWACPECGGKSLRAPVLGERRTAEEVGRAFPAVPVRTSSGDKVLTDVPGTPAIVVATPGAEPVATGGYACVVLLDTWLALARPDLRTAEESLRRWMNAVGLARGADAGGHAVVVGDSAEPAVQALVRWDPAGFADRELADRASAHLPPASRLVSLTGGAEAVDDALASLRLPDGAEVLGPVPVPESPRARDGSRSVAAADTEDGRLPGGPGVGENVRVVLRVPRAAGARLSRALVEMQGVRDAKKHPPVRVQVDPVALG